jgi:hypothetical protein
MDEVPELFSVLSKTLVDAGHQVYVITGPPDGPRLREELQRLNITYTHLFSIVDYHKSIGTEMMVDDKGNHYLDDYLWDKTKGDFCLREGIDLHIDDSDSYSFFFKTPYCRFFSKNKRKYFRKDENT